jgi:hypothetical protein
MQKEVAAQATDESMHKAIAPVRRQAQRNTVAKQLLLKDSRERWAYPTLSLSVTELKEIQL